MPIAFSVLGVATYRMICYFEKNRPRGYKRLQPTCPHKLHGRLRVYGRPLRRFGRKEIRWLCAGCGKEMYIDRSGGPGGPQSSR